MIKVYAFSTPNSVRVPIALEELGLEYELHPVNVKKGEQKQPEYLRINPNGKVPVIVDSESPNESTFTLSESAAILIYLAEKTGRLLPSDSFGRARVLEQIFFHVTGVGPAMGQLGYFKNQASEKVPSVISRFQRETDRVLAVLDHKLSRLKYVAGPDFTIADIAHFGWLWRREFAGITFADFPNIARWYDLVMERPAVGRAIARLASVSSPT